MLGCEDASREREQPSAYQSCGMQLSNSRANWGCRFLGLRLLLFPACSSAPSLSESSRAVATHRAFPVPALCLPSHLPTPLPIQSKRSFHRPPSTVHRPPPTVHTNHRHHYNHHPPSLPITTVPSFDRHTHAPIPSSPLLTPVIVPFFLPYFSFLFFPSLTYTHTYVYAHAHAHSTSFPRALQLRRSAVQACQTYITQNSTLHTPLNTPFLPPSLPAFFPSFPWSPNQLARPSPPDRAPLCQNPHVFCALLPSHTGVHSTHTHGPWMHIPAHSGSTAFSSNPLMALLAVYRTRAAVRSCM